MRRREDQQFTKKKMILSVSTIVLAALCLTPTPSTVAFVVGPQPRRHQSSQTWQRTNNKNGAAVIATTTSTPVTIATTALYAATLNDTSVDARRIVNGRKQPTTTTNPKRQPPTVTIEPTPTSSNRRSSTSSPPPPSPPQVAVPKSFRDSFVSSSISSAGAMAFAAVNAAVALQSLEAPDVSKSYIARDNGGGDEAGDGASKKVAVDENGLPLVYDKALIEEYWKSQRGALNRRWTDFINKAIPFLTKLVTLYIRDGAIMDSEIPELSRQARMDLQELGPTFIKAGQMMSVRPDVLPQATLDELAYLQDSVVPFDSDVARTQIETELGGPITEFFSSLSAEPVAAASLAQVYVGTLLDGTKVAVKVQRPNVLGTVSKDLYVLRRAAEVWQGLVKRFAPQQRTDYVALLNEWAVGFYTELDFLNEAQNQKRLRQLLMDRNVTGVIVPKVYEDFCTRRVLVSEWIEGTKLSQCTMEEIAEVTPQAQEAFLTQLFEVGFFHADPHPGNLLLLDKPTAGGAKLALIDCGLMASIDPKDRDNMISALIHLANKDFPALVDDFVNLGVLPTDCNRAAVIPLMDKALSPYIKGGGAKKYEEEVLKLYGMDKGSSMQSQVGGFQAMTQDALTVLNDIPFSIPPYFALLGRAIVTLEGVALSGDPNYAIIRSSYPFVARKLLREGRPQIQKALQEVLYSSSSGDGSSGLKLTRLLALLNNAAGNSVANEPGAAFVDLDAIPEDGALTFPQALKYLLSDNAEGLRGLLEKEVDSIVDVLSRQVFRRAVSEALVALTPPRPPAVPFLGDVFPQPPALDEIPLPIPLPGKSSANGFSRPSIGVLTIKDFTDTVAPKLTPDEDVFAIGLAEAAQEFFGKDVSDLIKGERVLSPRTVQVVLQAVRSGLLGRSDLLSSDSAASLLQFVDNTMQSTRQGQPRSTLEQDLLETVSALDDAEKQRLDDIVEELTRRAIARAVTRLAPVERIG